MKFKDWKTGASLAFNRRIDYEELKAMKDGGVDVIEMSFSLNQYLEDLNFLEKAPEYKAIADEVGVELRSIHLPFSGFLDISQLDDEKRDETVRIQRELMKAAAGIGVKIAVIHPSQEPISDEERPLRLANAKKNLTELAAYAKELGMKLAFEDLPRTCLVNHSDEAKYMLEGNPDLYIVFDTNHLFGQDNIEFIEAVGDRIITLHVSDYDYIDERHWLPLEGSIDWPALVGALRKKGYDGPWVYEVASDGGKIKHSDLHDNHMKLAELITD